MGITCERLEALVEQGCAVPGCDHVGHEPIIFLHGRCHTGSAVRVRYADDQAVIACDVCGRSVASIQVTAEPLLEENCRCRAQYEVSYAKGAGRLKVACRNCKAFVAEIPVAQE